LIVVPFAFRTNDQDHVAPEFRYTHRSDACCHSLFDQLISYINKQFVVRFVRLPFVSVPLILNLFVDVVLT